MKLVTILLNILLNDISLKSQNKPFMGLFYMHTCRQLFGEIKMSNQVTVIIPLSLRERAADFRLNISKVCRDALATEVQKCEQKMKQEIKE
jgi:hypothetical protein